MGNEKIRIGISVGDLNGIGLETVLKTFENNLIFDFCTPILFASAKVVNFQKKILKINVPINAIDHASNAVDNKFNVVNVWEEAVNVEFGKETKEAGEYAYKSLVAATEALRIEEVDVLVTAPINKNNIQSEEFKFPGHTEFLADAFNGDSLMFMVADDFRVGVVTGHVPVNKISEYITKELIRSKVAIINETLIKDFGIPKPKIAILGLNPHNGDKGVIGLEEEEVIKPVVKELFEEGNLVFGPYAADGFFGTDNYTNFDAILGMYHDQALIPFKTISFNQGINYTAGLVKIRTSPDHGTAYEIAGKGVADYKSFEQAVLNAIDIYKLRAEYNYLTRNVLQKQKTIDSRQKKSQKTV
ncbi:MAG: 4-hydroxythreonine-4-phosphate dehydrogenase PdxA [Ichthyobacteriaceae bacterium]|nr:4-hydroxythreonine-4-phosphate dehydrogenase PdxA [Ichthyobacteriaceae bacterium]